MARYLITGVAGFIGSWLARELVARGQIVRGIDNLSSGSLTNLDGIENALEFFHADLRSPKALELACQGVDFVFHHAAIDSVQQSIDDPIGTSSVNLDGTLHLIAAAEANHVKRIVFASSGAVYGDHSDGPVSEAAICHPQSPYATQKLSCEQYLANAGQVSGIETVSLRYFNVFGPRHSGSSNSSGVIAQFIHRMLSTNQDGPVIYGDGEQTRDFVYISDVVTANLLAMHAPAQAVAGKVFNIGTGRARSVRLTFEAVACMLGYTGEPRLVQPRPQDIRSSVASTQAAQQAFGFQPAVSLAEGLYKTVSFTRTQLSARPARPQLERRSAERTIPVRAETPPRSAAVRHVDAHHFAEAVKNNELELFYQPILDLAQSRVTGVEALLRWRTGNRLLTPAHFIHLAEEKGLTPIIGAWVLETACAQLAGFHKQFRPSLRLAVNVSPLQLDQRSFPRTVDSALTIAGIDHAMLDLEVVERTLVRDSATTQHNLLQLRRRGVRIAVDDFGTGYSNMNYLYRFPIDCLKIDQSFVQHKGHTRILDGIVAFARTLGVCTVAEGVETGFQLTHVTNCGCDEAQGFHIGRPVPATHLVQTVLDFEATLPEPLQLGDPRRLNLPPSSENPAESADLDQA